MNRLIRAQGILNLTRMHQLLLLSFKKFAIYGLVLYPFLILIDQDGSRSQKNTFIVEQILIFIV